MLVNPYVAIWRYFTPRRTVYPVALKPIRIIVTRAFVTFLNICGLKMLKKFQLSTSISNMAAGKWTRN